MSSCLGEETNDQNHHPERRIPMYQPMISDENIGRLYRMKLQEKRPMTKLINQILDDFFTAYNQDNTSTGRETSWTTSAQTDSPLRPLDWPSASSESSNLG